MNVHLNRRLNHYTTRMLSGRRPPPPNYLSIAVRALNAVIRSHKRLIKLAPELFDYAAIDREHRRMEAQRQLDQELQPALDRVYGPSRVPLSSNEKSV